MGRHDQSGEITVSKSVSSLMQLPSRPLESAKEFLFSSHGVGETDLNRQSIGYLLSRVYDISCATGSDPFSALYLLSLPSSMWDQDNCLHAYYSQDNAFSPENAIYIASDERECTLPNYATPCTSLFSTSQHRRDASKGDTVSESSMCCASCGLAGSFDLLALSCLHWICRSCWKTSLLNQSVIPGHLEGHTDDTGDLRFVAGGQSNSSTPSRGINRATTFKSKHGVTSSPKLHCPSCRALVPPAMCRVLFTEKEPLDMVLEYYAKSCLEEFQTHLCMMADTGDEWDNLKYEGGRQIQSIHEIASSAPAPAPSAGLGFP